MGACDATAVPTTTAEVPAKRGAFCLARFTSHVRLSALRSIGRGPVGKTACKLTPERAPESRPQSGRMRVRPQGPVLAAPGRGTSPAYQGLREMQHMRIT